VQDDMRVQVEWAEAICAEANALDRLEDAVGELADAARPLWHLGDGDGGTVLAMIDDALAPLRRPLPRRQAARKKMSPTAVLAIFARDGYRCLECGAREDLSVDHIQPVSKGGTDDAANLRTLCRSCNSRKGAR
jgi:DNA-directed RNA polymerase subunit RPC12/RpoP